VFENGLLLSGWCAGLFRLDYDTFTQSSSERRENESWRSEKSAGIRQDAGRRTGSKSRPECSKRLSSAALPGPSRPGPDILERGMLFLPWGSENRYGSRPIGLEADINQPGPEALNQIISKGGHLPGPDTLDTNSSRALQHCRLDSPARPHWYPGPM